MSAASDLYDFDEAMAELVKVLGELLGNAVHRTAR